MVRERGKWGWGGEGGRKGAVGLGREGGRRGESGGGVVRLGW